MTTGNRPPDLAREIRELKSEIRKLWKALSDRPGPGQIQGFMPFSWSGTVSGTRTSGPWPVLGGLTLTSIAIECTTAGGSATSVSLQVNGVTVGSFVLAAGSTRYLEQFSHPAESGDNVRLYVVGGGCVGLTVLVGFTRVMGT